MRFDVNHLTIESAKTQLRNNKRQFSFHDQSSNLKWESNKFEVLLFRRLATMINLVLFALMSLKLFPKTVDIYDHILVFRVYPFSIVSVTGKQKIFMFTLTSIIHKHQFQSRTFKYIFLLSCHRYVTLNGYKGSEKKIFETLLWRNCSKTNSKN